MNASQPEPIVTATPLAQVAGELASARPFAGVELLVLPSVLDRVELVRLPPGAVLGGPVCHYWILLEGRLRIEQEEPDGARSVVRRSQMGEGFGEVSLLSGRNCSLLVAIAESECRLLRFSTEQFWALLAACPIARQRILEDRSQRLESLQLEAFHREKLVSLGTMAAGLMHELHNPGAAARRASVELRGLLMRLQKLSLRANATPGSPEQQECLRSLLERSFAGNQDAPLSSLDETDAQERMAHWLEAAGVENAFTIAPALVGIGFQVRELECARSRFEDAAFSDALNWLEALVSSLAQLGTLEQSIARIADLTGAVKNFSYEEHAAAHHLDVHESLQTALTLLGHKLRLKEIAVQKKFAAAPSRICTRGAALSQVWTNLLDNAADASPPGSAIEIATWIEARGARRWLGASITDAGSGIAPELLPRIFEPFFTTKPQGLGTGLGLEIAHRIVTEQFEGSIEVESQPGRTCFTVRLPLQPLPEGACGEGSGL